MGQAHTKPFHDDDTSSSQDDDQSHQALEDVQRLLDADRIPRMLQEQVQNCLLNSDDDDTHDLTVQGFQVNRQVAEYAVSFLRMAALQQKPVTSLSFEHDIQDEASFQILIKQLRHQPLRQQLEKMSIQFWPLGTSAAARKCCSALLQSKSNWRVVDIRYSNLVFDNRNKTNMSFITQGLQAQTALEEFALGHGKLSHPQPITDIEVAEILKILSTKKRTLRSLVMRDCYNNDDDESRDDDDPSRSWSMQGQATTKALIQLVQPRESCEHGLDCRLEKLIWDLPCTHELYQDGSKAQKRFLAALLRNDTLLCVQLRRMTISAPLAMQVEACTRRNRNLAQVRKLVQPSLALTGGALAALACPRRGNPKGDERSEPSPKDPSQDQLALKTREAAVSSSFLSAIEEAMAVGSLAFFSPNNNNSQDSKVTAKRPKAPPADPLEVRASASAMFWALRSTVW